MTHWNQKHGYALPGRITSVYRSWLSAKARCHTPTSTQFQYYGGRGITMCQEWRDDFTAFLRDVGEKPAGATLERIDNDGHYEPGNVRWATKAEQTRNTRRNVRLTIWGKTLIVAEWARLVGVTNFMIHGRLRKGFSPERAVFEGLMAARPPHRKQRVGPVVFALLMLMLSATSAFAQAGFLQAVPGTARPTCASIAAPVTNQTWCATAEGAPGTYLWKVWNGTTYVTVGGGGGGGGNAIALNNQLWATFPNQFFGNDANVTISSGGGVHTLGWAGCLPISRGGIGNCTAGPDTTIAFWTSTPGLSGDAGFEYNATTHRVGIGTAAADTLAPLDIHNDPTTNALAQVSGLKVDVSGTPANPNPAVGDFVATYSRIQSSAARNRVWAINTVTDVPTDITSGGAAWGLEVDVNSSFADAAPPFMFGHVIGIEAASGGTFAPSTAFATESTTNANRFQNGFWLEGIGGKTDSIGMYWGVSNALKYGIYFANGSLTGTGGAIRIPNNQAIVWRNFADGADLPVLYVGPNNSTIIGMGSANVVSNTTGALIVSDFVGDTPGRLTFFEKPSTHDPANPNFIRWHAPNSLPASWECTLPDTHGTAGQVLSTDGASPCVLSWTSGGGTGTVTGSGAATQISVWTSASNITGFPDFKWDDANAALIASQGLVDNGGAQEYAVIGGNGHTIGGAWGPFAPAIIGGIDNTVGGDATEAGDYSVVAGGNANFNAGAYSFMGGGSGNTIADTSNGFYSAIIGGTGNILAGADSAFYSVILGGSGNTLDSDYSVIAGGTGNSIAGGGVYNFIGGGAGNSITNTLGYSAIAGTGNAITHEQVVLLGSNLASVSDNSVSLGVSATPEVTITANLVELGQIGAASVVLQFDGSTSGTVGLVAPAVVSTPWVGKLPVNPGNPGDFLTTDGGNPAQLAWAAGSGASGITSLNGLSAAVQTVAAGSTNINWSSAVATHTFTWTGQLSALRGGTGLDTSGSTGVPIITAGTWSVPATLPNTRGGTGQNSSAWSALPLVTAGTWSQYAGSTCPGGQAATSISATGVLTCSATGSGTVTHTVGALTLGIPVVGNGGGDIKSMPGNLTNSVYYSTGAGAMNQETNFSYFDSPHTLVLGVGSLPPSAAWGAPKLFAATLAEVGSNVGATGPNLRLASSNGTIASPTATVTNDVLGTVDFRGYDGTNGLSGARIFATVSTPPSVGFIPAALQFETTDQVGAKHIALTLRGNGNVALGKKLIGYNGFGATDGSLLIGNGAGGMWDANTLTAGPGISITNGPGTISIAATGSGAPSGIQGATQFNNSGAFGGDRVIRVAAYGTTRAAIQSAITTAPAGSIVQLDCINYVLDGTTISIPKALTLQGCGIGGLGTITSITGAVNQTAITIASIDGVVISNLNILQSGTSTGIEVNGIVGSPGSGCTVGNPNRGSIFENIEINGGKVGISVVSGTQFTIQNARLYSQVGANSYGVLVRDTYCPDSGDSVIANSWFETGATAGIRAESGGGLKIIGNGILGSTYGVIVQPPVGVTFNEFTLVGNKIGSPNAMQHMLLLDTATNAGSSIFTAIIGNNIFDGPALSCIAMTGDAALVHMSGVTITGNQCTIRGGGVSNGILGTNVVQRVSISGNVLDGQTGTAGSVAINLGANVTETDVGVNQISRWGTNVVGGASARFLLTTPMTFAQISAAIMADGSSVYCSDCKGSQNAAYVTGACSTTAPATGALLKKQGGSYQC